MSTKKLKVKLKELIINRIERQLDVKPTQEKIDDFDVGLFLQDIEGPLFNLLLAVAGDDLLGPLKTVAAKAKELLSRI